MKWIITFLSTYIVKILTFFIKKFGYASVLLTIQKTFQAILFVIFFAFVTFTTNYILRIWNLLITLVHSFNNFGSGISGATYGGVDLSTIVQVSKSFFVASGLNDAFVLNGNLLMAILSLIFIKALWKLYVKIAYQMYKLLNDGLNLLSYSIWL